METKVMMKLDYFDENREMKNKFVVEIEIPKYELDLSFYHKN